MSDQKYVPANVFLRCDKGVAPCQLKVLRPGPDLYDEKWAVEGDALPGVNVTTFGVCAMTHAPCVPLTTRWQNTLMGALQIDAAGIPQNPLLDNSFLPCTAGGKIDIFFTRVAVTQALQATADAQQMAAAQELSHRAKIGSMLLLGAGILVAGILVVATGGAALVPLMIAAGTAGAVVGGGVGAVAGGLEGYAHGGALGAVEGAAGGLVAGAVVGGLGGAAAAVGGAGAALFMGASAVAFGVATAADAFTFYKQPTLEHGLVLLGDLVVMLGGKLVEGEARGARELETPSGGPKEKCTKAGDPVDVAGGAMFFDAVDVALPGPVPFRWERTWYSNSVRTGPLGHGWHHCYDLALFRDAEAGTVAMRLADGRLAMFELPGVDNDHTTYHRPRKLELRPLPDGAAGYAVRNVAEGLTYRFTPAAHRPGHYALAAIANGRGHAICFTYSEQGHLQAVVDSANRAIGVRTDAAGRILALDLPLPDGTVGTFPAVQYAYDEAGNMLAVTDAEGHAMRFAYHGHLMVQKTFRTGMSFYFEYDAQNRCTHTWGDEGYFDCRFAYAPGHTTVHTVEPAASDVYFHERGLVTTHINALGDTYYRRYNAHDELEAEQNALGHTTTYDYDSRGNCTSITHPDGSTVQSQYNDAGQLLQATDANGHAWRWHYDEHGQLAECTDPTGASTRYRHDGSGHLIEVRDALDHPTRLRYDDQHNLAHIVTLDGNIRSRTYDALGRLVALTDAAGNKQRRRYDRLGQLLFIQEPDGQQTQLSYDGDGNVTRAHNGTQEVSFAYTAVNRLAMRQQNGQKVAFAYDRGARLVGLTNEHGRHYHFSLDAAGRVAAEEGFDGVLRRYDRDAAGRVTAVHRPAGRTTAYAYDVAGRPAVVAHNNEAPTTYHYDATGALIEASTATATVQLERDPLGRVVREHRGAHTIHHEYDARGQRVTLRSSLGAAFAWQHDAMGNLAAVQAGESWQARLLHDARGLELQRQLSGGVRLDWSRDDIGRPTNQRVAVGQQPTRQRRYEWEETGQLAQIEDSVTGTTRYTYDASGSLTGARYDDGSEDVRLLDAVGNLFRSPTHDDRQYAPGGQLLEANGIRYKYDEEGNLVQKKNQVGEVWRYVWDGEGQLTSVALPSGYSVAFTYDALGRRLSKRYRGRVTKWIWDGDVPLHEWSELEVGFGAGSIDDLATWLFEEGRLAPTAKFTPRGSYSVVTDHLGTPIALYDQHGQQSWEMQLSAYGQVRQGQGKAQDCPFRYQGQYEDVETGLYYNRFRYYDPEVGMYISQDPIRLAGGANLYGYVRNPTSYVDLFGLSIFDPITWTAPSNGTGNTYKVYQQPINWDLPINGRGGVTETNLDRASRGQAPFVEKGGRYSQVNLHHSQQNAQGPLYELSAETHSRYQGSSALHPHLPNQHPDHPVNRELFGVDREAYWQERANAEQANRAANTTC